MLDPRITLKEIESTKQMISIFKKLWGDIYDYSKTKLPLNKNDFIIVSCKIHGDFKTKYNSHVVLQGCKKCIKTTKITKNIFIEKCHRIYHNFYNYDIVSFQKRNDIIKIKCPTHGVFTSTPQLHLRGGGCPECRYIKISNLNNNSNFYKDCLKIHNNKYEYFNDYVNQKTKIKIKCPEHGIFYQRAGDHFIGKGCNICSTKKASIKLSLGKDIFIKRASKTHNNFYCYGEVEYINCSTKVKINCPKHGVFLQRPASHLKGAKCPKCINRISKGSSEWLDYLKIINREVYFKNLKLHADGYDEKTKTVYLYHGDYWHGNPDIFKSNDYNKRANLTFKELYEKTLSFEKRYVDNGYYVITMWENDWNKFKNERKQNGK